MTFPARALANYANPINHSTIRHNHIVMDGSNFGAITLYTGGNANVFSQNVVEGSAAYALGLASPFLPALFPATDNVFRGNRLQRFTPVDSVFWGPGAHILFDENASDNVLVGRSGIVKDLGQNNSATGPRSRDSARRRALQAKLAAKRDLRPARPAPVEEALEQAAVSPRRRSIALAPR